MDLDINNVHGRDVDYPIDHIEDAYVYERFSCLGGTFMVDEANPLDWPICVCLTSLTRAFGQTATSRLEAQ
jgi:hypothetical protein